MDESAAQLLAHDRGATLERIASLDADLQAVDAASAGSNQDDEHDPEGVTLAFEREQLASLRTQGLRHLDDVLAALVRLAAGRYERCERCGTAIAPARLEALPATRWCIDCAS